MSFFSYKNVAISGVSACVPRQVIDNLAPHPLLNEAEVQKAVASTGILQRRIAAADVCSSDLCFKAAEALLAALPDKKSDIDMLVFVSQTPDYRQPATAPILQHRLGLPKTVGSFDINLACSGYVYALSVVYALAAQGARVLLLVGETCSKVASGMDRATCMLFGDAGTATLVEPSSATSEAWFSLNSDGSGCRNLLGEGGGYRLPSSIDTLRVITYPDGSQRSAEQWYMDGMEVFNFTMAEIPKDVLSLLNRAGRELGEVDYCLLHQANRYIMNHMAKKLKIPQEKLLVNIDRYGNTSSASLPLLMTTELKPRLTGQALQVLLSGFGAGFSWGSAWLTLPGNLVIPPLVEY